LVPIAAGLVLIVLAAHLRHLNRRTRTATRAPRPRPAPVLASAPDYGDDADDEHADDQHADEDEQVYDYGDEAASGEDEVVAPPPRRRTLGRRRAALRPVVAAPRPRTVTLLEPEPEEFEEDLEPAPARSAGIHDDEWDFALLGEDDVTIAAEARVIDAVARTESKSAGPDDAEQDDDVVYEVVSPVR
jgi:hypothetical protein